jgi:hypothetical protein
MRLNRTTLARAVLTGVALLTPAIPASADPIVWTGPSMTFTKPDFADFTLPGNQDRLTDNVWLTRRPTRPLFNVLLEDFADISVSPLDTEWAFGPTQPGNPGPITASNFANLVFEPFVAALAHKVGNNAVPYGPGVLHLISDDVYLDIRFKSWTQESGGGFSYIRSTPDQSPVPEPATATLLLVGAVTGVAVRRRKQHTRS